MAYNAVAQSELETLSDDDETCSPRSASPIVDSNLNIGGAARIRTSITTDTSTAPAGATSNRISAITQALSLSSPRQSYEMVEEDDRETYEEDHHKTPGTTSPSGAHARDDNKVAMMQHHQPRPSASHEQQVSTASEPVPAQSPPSVTASTATTAEAAAKAPSASLTKQSAENPPSDLPISSSPTFSTSSQPAVAPHHPRPKRPIVRTASDLLPVALRHPTPDLHTLQGAYVSNVEHLEKTAERLSMTSSIEDAIREMHDEQKRADSRRSSLLASPVEGSVLSRQFSNPNSIVELNSTARSGGYSPGGFQMISPPGSVTSLGPRRSGSKSSRFGSRPEPEREGRPLEAFGVSRSQSTRSSTNLSPIISRVPEHMDASAMASPTAHEAEMQSVPEDGVILERDLGLAEQHNPYEGHGYHHDGEAAVEPQPRPASPTSILAADKEDAVWENFDGVHYAPSFRSVSMEVPPAQLSASSPVEQRVTPPQRLPLPRPKTYDDPATGQQMVYYPAPVPMILNLPQKLSKQPPTMARTQRRSQVLSAMPQARQSWLPEVSDTGELIEPESQYDAQDYRQSMGPGRNLNVPPQLRASAFFEQPSVHQTVELKGDSAVTTLDSILDASANAPVNAFTDHAYAGHLGAEVYGKSKDRASKAKSQVLAHPAPEKRSSSLGFLLGKRRGSQDGLAAADGDKQHSTVPNNLTANDEEDAEDYSDSGSVAHVPRGSQYTAAPFDESDDEDHDGEHMYQGAPTTLLAELQLRKQQQKQRTRPLTQVYPNGMHSTLVQLDAVAQVEQRARKSKRINLAWEANPDQGDEVDNDGEDEVPLGMLYAAKREQDDRMRPLGLMEQREMEENEPLSRRRQRLTGRPAEPKRASTMMYVSHVEDEEPEVEGETLRDRMRRLREGRGADAGLPAGRSVSNDFASELLSQFGGDLLETQEEKQNPEPASAPTPDAEETLGQRRKRLQAERETQAAAAAANEPQGSKRHSMADVLSAHPVGARQSSANLASSGGGLLAEHDRLTARRASTMAVLTGKQNPKPENPRSLSQNIGFQGDTMPSKMDNNTLGSYAQQRQMMLGMNAGMPLAMNGIAYNTGYGNMNMGVNMGMGFQQQPIWQQQQGLYAPGGYAPYHNYTNNYSSQIAMSGGTPMAMANPRQIDRVERWRQSVMQ